MLFELTLTEKGVSRNDESLTKLFKMTSVLSNNSMVSLVLTLQTLQREYYTGSI